MNRSTFISTILGFYALLFFVLAFSNPLFAQPIGNRGIYFDGIDDYIDITNTAGISFPNNSDFTVSFWIKNQRPNTYQIPFRYGTSTGELGVMVELGNSNELNFATQVHGGPWNRISTSPNVFLENEWVHVALTWSNGNKAIFINGNQVAVGYQPSAGATAASVRLRLGANSNMPALHHFRGQLDEVRIFSSVRTPADIATDMSTSTPNGAVGFWRFEEGTGSVASNTGSAGATANGTLTNGPLWALRVKNTNDAGAESLRDVITQANGLAGKNYVDFSIVGGMPHTITLNSNVPDLFQPLLVDGTSQLGYVPYSSSGLVRVNSGGASWFLRLFGAVSGTEIYGLWLTGFDSFALLLAGQNDVRIGAPNRGNVISGCTDSNNGAIQISGGSNIIVQSNRIGTNPEGTAAAPNAGYGINIQTTPTNVIIGGTRGSSIGDQGEGNLISGNGRAGIISFGNGHIIQGNLIGLSIDQSGTIGNAEPGIHLSCSSCTVASPTLQVGGSMAARTNNIIGGNQFGILVGSPNVNVEGNLIGIDENGTVHPNVVDGVSVSNYFSGVNPTNIIIGSTLLDRRNIISGNGGMGIRITAGQGTQIVGNYIGTNIAGTTAIPNQGSRGVSVETGNNIVGGTTPAHGNLIAGNTGYGLEITQAAATNNSVFYNKIGTDVTGLNPLPNASGGVYIFIGGNNVVGGNYPNLIAYNNDYGVRIGGSSAGNSISKNQIYCNGNTNNGIDLFFGTGNVNKAPPSISAANVATNIIQGNCLTCLPGEFIEVFRDNSGCGSATLKGATEFLGDAVVASDLSWSLVASPSLNIGDFLTATARDASNNTSPFSLPFEVIPVTYYSRQTGDWGDVNTWSIISHVGAVAGAVPTAVDNVIIGDTHTVTLDVNAACNDLTVAANSRLEVESFDFTANGTTTISGNWRDGAAGGTNTFRGLLTVNDGATFVVASVNSTLIFEGGILNLTTTDFAFNARNQNDVIFNVNDQTVHTYSKMRLGDANTGDMLVNVNLTLISDDIANDEIVCENADTRIAAAKSVSNQGHFVSFYGTLIGLDASSAWVNEANSYLNIRGGGPSQIVMNGAIFQTNASNNTVHYSRGGPQAIRGNQTYHHLRLYNDTKTLNNDVIVNGDLSLTVSPATTLDFNNFTINLKGNLVADGTCTTVGNGALIFDGTNAQLIQGTATNLSLPNVTLNNAAGLTVQIQTSVRETLNLTAGIITLQNQPLILTNATVASQLSGTFSNTCYIATLGTGLFKRNGEGAGSIDFPVGDNTELKLLTLSQISDAGVRYIPNPTTPLIPAGLHTPNGLDGLWEVTMANPVTTNITLTNPGGGTTSASTIHKHDGTNWQPILPTDYSPAPPTYEVLGQNLTAATHNFAILAPPPPPTQPIGNRGMYFDGTNDYIDITNTAGISFPNNSDFTISFWIKNQRPNTYQIPFRYGTSAGELGVMVELDTSNELNFATQVHGGPWNRISTSPNVFLENEWVHVALTWSNGSKAIFINGVSVATANQPSAGATAASVRLRLGANSNMPALHHFRGQLDEVRIFSSVRTPAQIIADMSTSTPNGAVGFWRFEEGTGSVASNTGLVGATANGTLTNGPLWALRVKNTNDAGAESLRDVITQANGLAGKNYIDFSIEDPAPWNIQPLSNLPFASEPILIEGNSQKGWSNTERIRLDNSSNTDGMRIGLDLTGAGSEVYGLEISNTDGTSGGWGIYVNADNVTIGATGKGNVINNIGNSLGAHVGIYAWTGATNLTIQNNYIGTNAAGTAAVGSNSTGIRNYAVSGVVIRNNLVSGMNAGQGVAIELYGAATLSNNIIGLGSDLTTAIPNNAIGVRVLGTNANNTLVGGSGFENRIANSNIGVAVESNAVGVQILDNQIYCNSNSNILLNTGGNIEKQAPLITSASPVAISGICTTCSLGETIQVYRDVSGCSPAGGTQVIGTTTVLMGGNWTLLGTFSPADVFTATARDGAGNTSPFSFPVTISDPNVVTNLNDSGAGSLRFALSYVNNPLNPETEVIFNIPLAVLTAGNYTINLLSPLPAITRDAVVLDGKTTQETFLGAALAQPIRVSGGGSLNQGLVVMADDVEVSGLAWTGFNQEAIVIEDANNVVIGKAAAPNFIYGNMGEGIEVSGTNDNLLIQYNHIGLDEVQNPTLPNSGRGILVESPTTLTNTTIQNNIIAANLSGGIAILSPNATNLVINDNLVGITSTDTPAPNGEVGIVLDFASQILVQNNIISAHDDPTLGTGIYLDSDASNIELLNNKIGTNLAGDAPIGNTFGIRIGSCDDIRIGLSGNGNLISGNGLGIQAEGTTNLQIRANTIGLNAANDAQMGNDLGINFIDVSNALVTDNLISGNDIHGMLLEGTSSANEIYANRFGTNNDVSEPSLGNDATALHIQGSSTQNQIGSDDPLLANVFVFNDVGIAVQTAGAIENTIGINRFRCNNTAAVTLSGGGNIGIVAPTPDGFTQAGYSGTGVNAGDKIDVYQNHPCADAQGAQYIGSTVADAEGRWYFANNFSLSDQPIALRTDPNGNSSPFSVILSASPNTPSVLIDDTPLPDDLLILGQDEQIIYNFQITVANFATNLEHIRFLLNGTYIPSDISSLNLHYSSTNDILASSIIESFTPPASGSEAVFLAISQNLPIGTHHFWITVDIPANPTIGATVQVSDLTAAFFSPMPFQTENAGASGVFTIGCNAPQPPIASFEGYTYCDGDSVTISLKAAFNPQGNNISLRLLYGNNLNNLNNIITAPTNFNQNALVEPTFLVVWAKDEPFVFQFEVQNDCSGANAWVSSSPVSLDALPMVGDNLIGDSHFVLPDQIPYPLLDASTQTPDSTLFTFQWQASPDSVVWTDLVGENGLDLYFDAPLTAPTYFRRKAIYQNLCEEVSNAVLVDVLFPPYISQYNPDDSLALVAIYQATGGANWTNSWNLNDPVYTWHGVTLLATLEGNVVVKNLNLAHNNLTGTMPPQTATLVYRQGADFTLDISHNRLGFLSAEPFIGELNGFRYAPQDSIHQAQYLTRQESDSVTMHVNTAGNFNTYQWYKDGQPIADATTPILEIGAVLPADMGEYTCLVNNTVANQLTLHRRKIFLNVIPFVNPLDSMVLVDLFNSTGGNSTWKKPWNLNNPVGTWQGITFVGGKVTEIDLSNSGLTGEIPASFNADADLIQNLIYLNLSGNELSGTIPAGLGSFENLLYLDLSGNNFAGTVPSEIGNLQNLLTLDLSDNELTQLPASINNLTSLQNLILRNNQLGAIPALGNLTELLTLDISHNLLVEMPAGIPYLIKLQNLYAHVNFVENWVENIATLQALRNLTLYQNRLYSLPEGLSRLPRLQRLAVGENRLEFDDLLPLASRRHSLAFSYAPQADINLEIDTLLNSGESYTLRVETQGQGNVYRWYQNGNLVFGLVADQITFNRLTARRAGVYVAEVRNAELPALTLYRRPIRLRINCNSIPVEVAVNQTTFCDNVGILALMQRQNPIEGEKYQWYYNGNPIFRATASAYSALRAGVYWLEIQSDRCISRSDSIWVQSVSVRQVLIAQSGNLLSPTTDISAMRSFQWYRNGEPLLNAVAPLLEATMSGEYYLEYIDENGCLGTSNRLTVNVTGQEAQNPLAFIAYPNPTQNRLFIQFETVAKRKCFLRDLVGRQLLLEQQTQNQLLILDLGHLPKGLYLIEIQDEQGQSLTQKVFVE